MIVDISDISDIYEITLLADNFEWRIYLCVTTKLELKCTKKSMI
jgi:hypothetical protein